MMLPNPLDGLPDDLCRAIHAAFAARALATLRPDIDQYIRADRTMTANLAAAIIAYGDRRATAEALSASTEGDRP